MGQGKEGGASGMKGQGGGTVPPWAKVAAADLGTPARPGPIAAADPCHGMASLGPGGEGPGSSASSGRASPEWMAG